MRLSEFHLRGARLRFLPRYMELPPLVPHFLDWGMSQAGVLSVEILTSAKYPSGVVCAINFGHHTASSRCDITARRNVAHVSPLVPSVDRTQSVRPIVESGHSSNNTRKRGNVTLPRVLVRAFDCHIHQPRRERRTRNETKAGLGRLTLISDVLYFVLPRKVSFSSLGCVVFRVGGESCYL